MAILNSETENGVCHLTMNNPERLNALSKDMLAALDAEIARLAQDRTTRAVVLSGAGKAFCAGHDLKEMTAARESEDLGASVFAEQFGASGTLMQAIQKLPQPVIAQVHGIATAAGCQLVASCDMAVAAEGTRFGVNGVNIGLFCSTPMVALTRNILPKQAFEMLTTGDFISADKAVELGLINRVVPAEELAETTQELADKVASKLGSAIRLGKRAFYDQLQMPLDQAYDYTRHVMTKNMVDPDTSEGVTAFVEKRKATWKNE